MTTLMKDAIWQVHQNLCYEPTDKRVRAVLGDRTVVDTTRALLVWEPKRIAPSYAVPVEDLSAELVPPETGLPGARPGTPAAPPPVLHPGIPFSVHSTAGEPLSVRSGDNLWEHAAFRPADPELNQHVILDFRAFDAWYEEDDRLFGHVRNPYHRVDIRPSSRHVRVELDGRLLAESTRPVLVFETGLPTRFYLPREDIRAELAPSRRKTYCAYKGEASYWTTEQRRDLVWSYLEPLPDAAQLKGLVAFFDELVDLTVDGVRRERPDTPFAKALVTEAASREAGV